MNTAVFNSLSATPALQSQYAFLMSASQKSAFKSQTTFPNLTSNDPTGRKNFLAYVSGLAGQENVDQILAGEPDFALDAQRPDFEALMGVGDSRFSLGMLLSAIYEKYEPRVEILRDFQQTGGCQIIDNYICTEDGVPIRKVSDNCIGVDTTPITSQEVITYVTTAYNQAFVKDADGFIKFLETEYVNKGWDLNFHTYADLPIFFVRVSKNTEKNFFKYYYEMKDYVASYFNETITPVTQELITDSFLGINSVIASNINSYAAYTS